MRGGRGRALAAVLASVVLAVGACDDDHASETIPVAVAPPSRHAALHASLVLDAEAFGFEGGDWTEDLGDAPFFGVAWLARRGEQERRSAAIARARTLLEGDLLEGDLQDRVMAAFGLVEHIDASGDRAELALLDDFVDRLDSLTRTLGDYIEVGTDRSWALRTYGPTAVTALVALLEAQYALLVGGDRGPERLERARRIDAEIVTRAFGDLVDARTGRSVRGYAIAPGRPDLEIYPNVAMVMLKVRLFRLTKDETYRLEARAIHAAMQPLKVADAPVRYTSPYAAASVRTNTGDVSTLSSQNYLVLALLLLFEITGEPRFVDEADSVLDAVERMRGPWCTRQIDPDAAVDRCAAGLLHHVVDGRLASPGDGTLFCSGCNLQTLYVLGYRRMLAREAY